MNEPQLDLGAVLIGVMSLFACGGLVWFLVRRHFARFQPGYSNPREIFEDLCAAHALNPQSVSLLERLAAWNSVQPALLFLEPAGFRTEGLDAQLAPRAADIIVLRDKLFAESSTDGAVPSQSPATVAPPARTHSPGPSEIPASTAAATARGSSGPLPAR